MTAQLCFIDWETQGPDLTVAGALRYVLDPSTQPLLLSYGTDDAPIDLWIRDIQSEMHPDVWAYIESRVAYAGDVPPQISRVAVNPEGYFVAWNMAFDRHVWQQVAAPDYGFPEIKIEKTLDAMAQGQASNLPGSLEFAGRALNIGAKTAGGKSIMKRFASTEEPLPGSKEHIAALPDEAKAVRDAIGMWAIYLDYSVQDTELMRQVWYACRPLDATEWQEYWVSERINDRGMPVDLDVCRGAVAYREEEAAHIEAEVSRLTDGLIAKPTMTKQINEYLFPRLPDDVAENMVKARDDDGNVTRLTGAKDVMGRILEDLNASDTYPDDSVVELIEALQFGRSSSAIKFEKILNQEVDERLAGSYVFNGAGQTGRYSSRGVQLHNLVRSAVDNELDVLDMVAAQVPIERIRDLGPVSSVLSKLIRPTIVAPEGRTLVWGDWSAIEARVNPWLAKSRDADRAVLEPFRNGDDLYVLNAESIFNVPAEKILEGLEDGNPDANAMRQAGKVAVLALGFLGSVGALKAMARGYGMRLSDEEARTIVDGWRSRNRWARRFGNQCEEAMFSAINTPLKMFSAGRVQYQYIPNLIGGTLVCYLPDGRPLVYPKAKIKKVEKFGNMVDAITYLNGMGRRSMWSGLGVENVTQGTAASILRQTLVRIETRDTAADLIGHTHDEAITEVDEDKAEAFAHQLKQIMVEGFEWSEGLPLDAEVVGNWYYTKSKDVAIKVA